MLLKAEAPSSFAQVTSLAFDSVSAFDWWSKLASLQESAGNLPLAWVNIDQPNVRYSIQSNDLNSNFMAGATVLVVFMISCIQIMDKNIN